MRGTTGLSVATILGLATLGLAGRRSFSINDDVLAFPQFEISFPDEYVLEAEAKRRLKIASEWKETRQPSPSTNDASVRLPKQQHDVEKYGEGQSLELGLGDSIEGYQEMVLADTRFLCELPLVKPDDDTEEANVTSIEADREVQRATARGLELLNPLKGGCMYYMAGWWSYSFCYMNEIRQFHALPPGNGIPVFPPVEDTNSKAFVLGKFTPEQDIDLNKDAPSTELAELHTTGDSRYLVQRLKRGTKCDLTGREREIEVQFHCHHRATDRIAYIKETTTCHYLMVVHTPRLCNDPAFQPARQDDARPITCRPVIAPNEVPEWEAATKLLDAAEENPIEEKYPVIDGIHVGGRTLVDRSGKTLQEGRLAEVAGREKVELIASKHAGQVKNLQAQDYEKLHMTPEQLDQLKENLEKLSKGKAWKLEIVTVQGQPTLRGLLDAGDKEEEAHEGEKEEKGSGEEEEQKQGEEEVGSVEEMKEPDETPGRYDGPETEADGQEEWEKDTEDHLDRTHHEEL